MLRNAPIRWFKVAAVLIVFQIGSVSAFGLQAPVLELNGAHSQQVEQTLLDAAQNDPNSFTTQHNLGEYYLQQGRLNLGIPYLERARQFDPKNYDNGYDLSLAYLRIGDPAKAIAQLRGMIQQSETAELDGLLAEAEEKSGDYQSALEHYYRVAKLQPSEDSIFDLASFLLQHPSYEGFEDRALVFFRYGVEKYPRSAKLTVGLGVALYAQGRYDDAIQTLCAAVDLNPADPKPYQFLDKVSDASPAELPTVLQDLEKFVSLYPESALANYYYAMSLWHSSDGLPDADLSKVKGLLQKSISLQPDYYEAHFQLGVLYQDEFRYQDAITEFNRTLTLHPDFSSAHYRLALTYRRTHQKQLADEQFAILKKLERKQLDNEAEEFENNSGGSAKK
jgi:tetratricopeptide (TPR) repeat protein